MLKVSILSRCLVFFFALLPATVHGQAAAPSNLDFEQGRPGETPPGWRLSKDSQKADYVAETRTERPESGLQAARLSPPADLKGSQAPGNLLTSFDATPWRGKRVRFRAAIRVEPADPKDRAALWLRVDRAGGAMGFFDNMADRPPITGTDWKLYEITGVVVPDAETIYLGLMSYGRGRAWIDSASFESLGEAGAGNEPARPLDARGLDNLAAFTRLLGYVRFFHPSDQAATADWGKLAIAGVQAAEKPRNAEELARVLAEVFRPLAPTLRVYPTAGPRPALPEELRPPAGGARPEVVHWRHLGVNAGQGPGFYRSARAFSSEPPPGGRVTQLLDARGYAGRRVTARVWARTAGTGAVLRLRAYTPKGPVLLAESGPLSSREWRVSEVSAEVPRDAGSLEVGLALAGGGKAWWDRASLEVGGGGEEPEPLGNPDFETAGPLGLPALWSVPFEDQGNGYRAALSRERPKAGRRGLLLSWSRPEPLRPGAPLVTSLGGGVSALIPLALYRDSQGTLPRASGIPPVPAKPEGFLPSGDDRATRLADVALAWSVLQHFHPYLDTVRVDWPAELRRTLTAAATDPDGRTFELVTLRRMAAALQDGHAGVGGEASRSQPGQVPLLWEWIEDQLVVTQVAPTGAGELRPGDVVLAIGGRPVREALAEAESRMAAATPWARRWLALRDLAQGTRNEPVRLEARRAGGQPFTASLSRSIPAFSLRETRPEAIAELKPGIFYVDLDRVQAEDFEAALGRLAGARGIVFDLRGYPRGSMQSVVSHLIDRPVSSPLWNVPVVTRPDRQGWRWATGSAWIQPRAPRLRARLAFLADARAVSAAETFLGYVEGNHLAAIVGGSTAGTNGDPNAFSLPGYGMSWTGMKVLKQDGSQHHGVGIQPTVPASRTIQGVAAGRDELLEKAVEILGQ